MLWDLTVILDPIILEMFLLFLKMCDRYTREWKRNVNFTLVKEKCIHLTRFYIVKAFINLFGKLISHDLSSVV